MYFFVCTGTTDNFTDLAPILEKRLMRLIVLAALSVIRRTQLMNKRAGVKHVHVLACKENIVLMGSRQRKYQIKLHH